MEGERRKSEISWKEEMTMNIGGMVTIKPYKKKKERNVVTWTIAMGQAKNGKVQNDMWCVV